MRRARPLIPPLVILALLLPAVPASGATVQVRGDTVAITGLDVEHNRLELRRSTLGTPISGIRVVETGTAEGFAPAGLVPGPGCVLLQDGSAWCTESTGPLLRISANLGGGNDVLDARVAEPFLGGQLSGGAGDDQLLAGAGSYVIDGGSGVDRLEGGSGDDQLDGGPGNDMVDGAGGRDSIDYSGRDAGVTAQPAPAPPAVSGEWDEAYVEVLTGTSFADTLVSSGANAFVDGRGGDDHAGAWRGTVDGGSGTNTFLARGASVISLRFGRTDTGVVLRNFVNVRGSGLPEVIYGDGRANFLDGGGDTDVLIGGGGADRYRTSTANEDTVSFRDRRVGVVVSLDGRPNDGVRGEGDNVPRGFRVQGSSRGDVLLGSAHNDWLLGSAGNDYLNGGRGRDELEGGGGNDVVVARDGFRDAVYCGGGSQDLMVIDRRDLWRGCEYYVP